MPISQYFKGHGTEVLKKMRAKYGPRAESVFHATAEKKDMKPKEDSRLKKSMRAVMRGKGGSRPGRRRE